MNNINKTLYIPLYAKSYASKKGLFLKDKKAEEIWEKEGFLLKGKSKSKYLAYFLGIRSAVFDSLVNLKLKENPNAVVIHLGCGLDSRVLRINANYKKWYDVDFDSVINERKRYYSESDNYKMIFGDAKDCLFLNDIEKSEFAIVIMEGVSMYLTTQEMQNLFNCLRLHFNKLVVLVDCYSTFSAKMSKIKNPINDVGVTKVYGIDDPLEYQTENLKFYMQHDITPKEYINQLKGFEKFIFSKLYAGSFAKKLYKLYEYKKD